MSELVISGGRPLEGELTVHGAKNSVLPILAASLLAGGEVVLRGCPRLTDVDAALAILVHLGCKVRREGACILLDPSDARGERIPDDLMRSMRSSVLFLGGVLGRTGRVELSDPGGCELGERPIDLHLAAVRALGAQVREGPEGLVCAGRLRGCDVPLALPSVGATENAMLCAVCAQGETSILNAAREPEIVELQAFLNTLGARVRGAGGSVITVEGGRPLSGGEYTIMGDRVVAATLLSAAAAAGGEIRLLGVDWRHVSTVTAALAQAGCAVRGDPAGVWLRRAPDTALQAIAPVQTAPYPGFSTDCQPPLMAAMATGRGSTLFVENIFDSRFRHAGELRRMGADITVEGRVALVQGVRRLHGARVEARDLRGGGALAVAALGAEGESVLSGLAHIDRGYEALETMICRLGGQARRR